MHKSSLAVIIFFLLSSGALASRRSVPEGWGLKPVQSGDTQSLSELKDGVYVIELATERRGCENRDRLGFNNRTCSTALTSSLTSGPVMRSAGDSELWHEWMIRVQEPVEDDKLIVSIQAFVNPDIEDEALCLGYMSTFYGLPGYNLTCDTTPYGTGLFLNRFQDTSNSTNAQTWMLRGSNSEGFEIVAASKPDTCSRILAAGNCKTQPVMVQESSLNNDILWKFIRLYDLVAPSPPLPSPPPPTLSPPPPPRGPIPGPIIAGPSSTASGYVDVVVKEFPQDTRCSASSVVFEYSAVTIGSSQQTVEVPVSVETGASIPLGQAGYHTIYAFVKCTNGQITERSNGLTVFSQISETIVDPRPCKETLSSTSDWALGCGTESCTVICKSFSRDCNATGAQAVDTKAKGDYVAGLFDIQATTYFPQIPQNDAPVMDVYGNGTVEYVWYGVASDCNANGFYPEADQETPYPISRRFCCCGNNCPVDNGQDP